MLFLWVYIGIGLIMWCYTRMSCDKELKECRDDMYEELEVQQPSLYQLFRFEAQMFVDNVVLWPLYVIEVIFKV